MKNLTILNHPLVNHKTALLRDKNTDSKMFRELVKEIATILTYEAFRDVPTRTVTVETPLETTKCEMVEENSVAIIPILRAGLGMVEGVHSLFPAAKVGHLGMYRDHDTLLPVEYYCKLPSDMKDKVAVILDPMLATGGSSAAAISLLKEKGCKRIKLLSIIGAPEGAKLLSDAHSDVQIYVACMDRCLNNVGYILPGLGDAGDRLFGTK